jgi:2,4-dienoyl-CoA reductase-like NADH-dependent reductase (Old Yellow Enzyme family)
VTDAVHSKDAFIYCQLWHVGRATVPGLLGGADAVSSTTVPIQGKALDGTEYSATPPRVMTVDEIKAEAKEYAAAAKRAMEAGFDGVEIHS